MRLLRGPDAEMPFISGAVDAPPLNLFLRSADAPPLNLFLRSAALTRASAGASLGFFRSTKACSSSPSWWGVGGGVVQLAGERERDLLQVPHFFVGTL